MLAWVLGIIMMVSPVGQRWSYPEANNETEVEREARYRSIASDLLTVVYDPVEKPLLARNDSVYARAKTALVLLAIASRESGFRRDVDFGVGKYARGDQGRSWCLMQVQLGAPNEKTGKSPTRIVLDEKTGGYAWAYDGKTGYGGEDLVKDRKACFRAALHMVRVSFNACWNLPAEERLRVYAAGHCGEEGSKASRNRMGLAQRWMKDDKLKPPMTDADFLTVLHPEPAANDVEATLLFAPRVKLTGTYLF